MSFYALRADERNWFAIDETSGIYYRRLLPSEQQELVARTTERGRVDNFQLIRQVCLVCITGWEGYADPVTGEALSFPDDTDERARLIDAIPWQYLVQVGNAIMAADVRRKDLLGNSAPSSGSAGVSANGETRPEEGSGCLLPASAAAPPATPTTSPPPATSAGDVRTRRSLRDSRDT